MSIPRKNTGGLFKITGDWELQSKLLKEQFPQLTDADLRYETDRENELLNRIEAKLNKMRSEVIQIIKKG
jgi:hypothetical protein